MERIFRIFFDDVNGGAMELFSVSSSYNLIFITNDFRQILSSVVTEIPPVLQYQWKRVARFLSKGGRDSYSW